MSERRPDRPYDLQERTLAFAKAVRAFVNQLSTTLSNREDARQLIRSSGAIGANYIEANDSLGQKDFLMRARISRKEAKETRYWLWLVETNSNGQLDELRQSLIGEATELTRILSSIINKAKQRGTGPDS